MGLNMDKKSGTKNLQITKSLNNLSIIVNTVYHYYLVPMQNLDDDIRIEICRLILYVN
jgi:hypothetical protein